MRAYYGGLAKRGMSAWQAYRGDGRGSSTPAAINTSISYLAFSTRGMAVTPKVFHLLPACRRGHACPVWRFAGNQFRL